MSDDQRKPTIAIVGTGAGNIRALAAMSGVEPEPTPIIDPITQPPEVQGQYGRAWLCNVVEGLRRHGVSALDDAGVAHWLVEAPQYHPAWHSYSIFVCHLRACLTPRKTLFYLEGATHEIWVYAVDPLKNRHEMLATGIPKGMWLQPVNYAGQFIEITDDLARDRVRKVVQEICEGKVSPDTDFSWQWKERFGDHMQKDREKPIRAKEVML